MQYCFRLPVLNLMLVSAMLPGMAQTVVWQETFDGTSNWDLANLNQDLGGSCAKSNKFYISCNENGNSPGTCGTGCGSNNTLHLGSTTLGDIGAAYDAGGWSNCGSGCWLCNTTTNKRSWSHIINTTGHNDLTLEFDYIETGDGASDNAMVEYSTNNGSAWNLLYDPPKTNNSGCGGQGRWTHVSIPLPASCWNISTLRIAFKWVNNNDGAGSDPSFAVNDLEVIDQTPLPVELVVFAAHADGPHVLLEWATASEQDNAYFSVEHSRDARTFGELGRMPGAGNSQTLVHYAFKHEAPATGMHYYRLRQVDTNGSSKLSGVVPVYFSSIASPLDGATISGHFLVTGAIAGHEQSHYMLCDLQGRVLLQGVPSQARLRLPLHALGHGGYVLRLITPEGAGARVFMW